MTRPERQGTGDGAYGTGKDAAGAVPPTPYTLHPTPSPSPTPYTLLCSDGPARRGTLRTRRGIVQTPVFMPVGTQGTIKGIRQHEVAALGYNLILANAYHLYLRPGLATIEAAGGLHEFMAWNGAILTDSGGFQVASQAGLRQFDERGVTFRSYIDGTEHYLSPEIVVGIEAALGVDIGMVLDHCPKFGVTREEAVAAMTRTHEWAARALEEHDRIERPFAIFGITQGGVHADLRAESADTLSAMPFDGLAVGGLSVGEPKELMWPALEAAIVRLPEHKPRYLMGVGTPLDILDAIARGADMFDCVLPTRLGRNGTAYTSRGKINLRDAPYERDFTPLDTECECSTCRRYTRAYVHHLYRSGEILAAILITHHNLHLYAQLTADARTAIEEGRYAQFHKEYAARFGS